MKRAWSGSRPDGDVIVPLDATTTALAADRIVVARVAPQVSSAPARIDAVTVLFDTSASRAPGFRAEVDRLSSTLAELRRVHGENARLRLAVFDQVVTEIFDGPFASLQPRHIQHILARRPLGASDLGRALDWLGTGTPTSRAVLVTDGIPTLGVVEPAGLRTKVAALRGKVRRIDAVAVGGIRDKSLLGEVVRGNLDADGVVADGGLAVQRIAEKIGKTTVSGVKVAVPGSTWSWPAQIDGAQPGDETLVYAVFQEPRAKGSPVTIELSGNGTQRIQVVPRVAEGPLVERAAVRAEIERLTQFRSRLSASDAEGRDKLAKTIIDRSVKYRVLSDFTALLVLESESDYERYGIDRKALAGILAIGADGRISAPSRTRPLPPPAAIAAEVPVDGPRRPERSPAPPRTAPPQKPKAAAEPLTASRRMDSAPGAAAPPAGPALPFAPREGSARVVARDNAVDTKPEPKKEEASEAEKTANAPVQEGPMGRSVRVQAQGGAPAGRAAPAASPPPAPSPEAEVRVAAAAPPAPVAARDQDDIADAQDEQEQQGPPPYVGRMAKVMDLLANKQIEAGLMEAIQWQNESPGDVMAIVALGEALEATGRTELASRAYGSIIDLFPARADLRRYAGMRIERLGKAFAEVAVDTYEKAVQQRPDHLTGHRSYAWALVRAGRLDDAAKELVGALHQTYPRPISAGDQILREDLAIVAAAWMRREPSRKTDILAMLQKENLVVATEPSLRFILQWETDANDVDFHIRDGKRGHAFYSQRELRSGGRLYEDVTTGYGPECFAIDGEPTAYPYRASIHYYSRGPMGFGMGRLAILRHDGNGNLGFEERPFVVMNDHAYVQLGEVGPETAKIAPLTAR